MDPRWRSKRNADWDCARRPSDLVALERRFSSALARSRPTASSLASCSTREATDEDGDAGRGLKRTRRREHNLGEGGGLQQHERERRSKRREGEHIMSVWCPERAVSSGSRAREEKRRRERGRGASAHAPRRRSLKLAVRSSLASCASALDMSTDDSPTSSSPRALSAAARSASRCFFSNARFIAK